MKQARTEAAEAMAGVIESLKGNGLLDPDIQTQHFSIYQQFDYIKGQREFRGYSVTNTVSAKIRDLDTVGNVIDDAAEAGGDLVEINSIQFTIDDTTKLKMQARVAAMQDAQAKAQTLATEGGVSLGKPISISESGDFYVPRPVNLEFAFADDAAATVDTPIQSGQLQIRVTVNVIYEIECFICYRMLLAWIVPIQEQIYLLQLSQAPRSCDGSIAGTVSDLRTSAPQSVTRP